jgi:hypothetical protein
MIRHRDVLEARKCKVQLKEDIDWLEDEIEDLENELLGVEEDLKNVIKFLDENEPKQTVFARDKPRSEVCLTMFTEE